MFHRYLNNKVFASLGNGHIVVYSRDSCKLFGYYIIMNNTKRSIDAIERCQDVYFRNPLETLYQCDTSYFRNPLETYISM